MKINEKFEKYLITTGCGNLESKEKYLEGNFQSGFMWVKKGKNPASGKAVSYARIGLKFSSPAQ